MSATRGSRRSPTALLAAGACAGASATFVLPRLSRGGALLGASWPGTTIFPESGRSAGTFGSTSPLAGAALAAAAACTVSRVCWAGAGKRRQRESIARRQAPSTRSVDSAASVPKAPESDFFESLLAAAVGAPDGSTLLSHTDYQKYTRKAQADMLSLSANSPVTLDQGGNAGSIYGVGRREYQRRHGQLNLSQFSGVIEFDSKARIVKVGGKTDFKTLTRYLLQRGFTVPVVPEIDTVTVGGSIAGVVMESGSFRYGFTHNTVLSMDVLLPDGSIVMCSREENHELFAAIPHSYGTLGYVLSATLLVIPAKDELTVTARQFDSVQAAVDEVARTMEDSSADFVEGIIFGSEKAYTITASMAEGADRSFTWANALQPVVLPDDGRFIDVIDQRLAAARAAGIDAERGGRCSFRMSTFDYLWRWDCDMFWATRRTPALSIPWVRKILGRGFLRSKVLWVVGSQVRAAKEWLAETAWALLGPSSELLGISRPTERIIQDLGVRFEQVPAFAAELAEHVELPLWMCPVKCKGFSQDQPLFPLPADADYMMDVASFGAFPRNLESSDPLYHNRAINRVLEKFSGLKPFYSDVLYTREYMSENYGGPDYERLKAKFDAKGVLPHLYDKVVTA